MHPCLSVDEIIRLLACELVASKAKATAVSLACCSKRLEGAVLDVLWETQDRLTPLLKCLPQEVWGEENGKFSFKRVTTKVEWACFRKHTRRMRKLKVDTSKDPVTLDTLLTLQLRAADEPFLPILKIIYCPRNSKTFIPFIPFFLSPKTTKIAIVFTPGMRILPIASALSRISRMSLNLERINLHGLPRDPLVTEAVSEMLLACNRDSLRQFYVASPLTEDAREVLYNLPNLSDLSTVLQGRTLLPPAALPNLVSIQVEYGDDLDWLQGFCGTTLKKLESVWISSESEKLDNFLEEFESHAVAASAHNVLTLFVFSTSRSWTPNYSSLLSFKKLDTLEIEFSCDGGCFSTVDDDVIATLVEAMPKLKTLKLGRGPCGIPTGATVNGLIGLAFRCPKLSELRIHFQVSSLVAAATRATKLRPSDDQPAFRQNVCALKVLEVGETPIPVKSVSTVALFLLQIFPRIHTIKYDNPGWKQVAETIRDFRQLGTFISREGGRK
ncbi:hypothetical protein BJ322DRAFT_1059294 [Thelephora terrestris]|uniref:F-box domain-containing protein n=1 Tax=Thelephora terrestris TaxID=56493 RepID=A0A9P6HI02_9AGAM|nr:hypothetical protein BJ322DRAFT_1059294 [Thelephora terrestris]